MTGTATAPPPLPRASGSYWSVVGAQLRKNRVAMVAWRLVQGLLVVAAGAPLIAFNVPIVMGSGAGISFPLFENLFDRFLFPNGVDVFFNLLLLVGPAWWLQAKGLGAWRDARVGRAATWRWGLPLGVLAAVLLVQGVAAVTGASSVGWLMVGTWAPGAGARVYGRLARGVWDARALRRSRFALAGIFLVGFALLQGPFASTRPLVDWRVRGLETAASGGFAVFPLVPFHPDNIGERGNGPVDRSLRRPNSVNRLGCDLNGRDVAARLVFGTRISMTIGVIAVAIFILIGIVLGGLAGYYRGKVDIGISRLLEVMLCFPTIFLLLTIIAIMDSRSIFLIMASIGLVGWPGVARLVRGEFLRQSHLDYVVAATAQGIPQRRIIFGHVLPNCMGPVLVSATFGLAGAILTESGLAFLGLGDTTVASWGQMLNSGRNEGQWHLIFAPGFAIFFVVTVFNLLGEGLRDALDPKLRR